MDIYKRSKMTLKYYIEATKEELKDPQRLKEIGVLTEI